MYSIQQLWNEGNVAVRCQQKQEAVRICNMLHKLGYKWYGGNSYLNNPKGYEEYERYCISSGNTYGSVEYFRQRGFRIIDSLSITENNWSEITTLLAKLNPADLNEVVDNLKKKVEQYESTYYYITDLGSIKSAVWERSIDDYTRYGCGNFFKTKEEAEKEMHHRMTWHALKQRSNREKEPENIWNGSNKHWRVYYNTKTSSMEATFDLTEQQGMVYFPSKKAALEAVQSVGAENYLKYILRR